MNHPRRNPLSTTAGQALLVSVGYGIGAWLGFWLSFPPATTSVLWPPNAILAATLLLTAPRRWWIYLLAAFPAHVIVELNQGLPLLLVLGLFVTNAAEALVAATLMHRFSDAPARLDTLRRVATFVGCVVVVASMVTSFPDAAAVYWIRGEDFWKVFRTRLYSNMLAAIALVPAILLARPAFAALAGLTRRRRVEAGMLAVGLLGLGALIFHTPMGWQPPGSPDTAPTLLLPLLMWAAIRFGPGGASLSLLVTTLLALGAATKRTGPWATLPPSEGVAALQIFLTSLGIPLLCLAALTEDHRSVVRALQARLRFEGLLSRISAAFVHLPSDRMDEAFTEWLGRVGEFFGLREVLLLRAAEGRPQEVSHAWRAAGDEAAADPPWTVTVPLVAGQQVRGGLTFSGAGPAESRPDERDQRLIADVLAGALASKNTEHVLRAGERMKSAILTSLTSLIAVLDRDGRIIAVNEAWNRFAHEGGSPALGPGASYLESCRSAPRPPLPETTDATAGIERVLAGRLSSYRLEYACRTPAGERWFNLSVAPLQTAEGGAVVSHTDVTDWRRAAMEAQRSREQLAHFLRVSTMGELASSLAHELNQPLTAALANAQAAHLLLSRPNPDLVELRETLADIIEEGRRAGEVIRRLKAMLRKGEAERVPLDVNDVVRDVVKLLGSDAVIRNVSIRAELDPESQTVTGDRIQLQQVILNLILNAMDAMAEEVNGDRTIVVRTEHPAPKLVRVAVEDAGMGLRPDELDRAFDPFYTTKAEGMGMGLTIARSIIEAHAGTITATNRPAGGAVFAFSLPSVSRSAGKPPTA